MVNNCYLCEETFSDPRDVIMCSVCKNYFHSGCCQLKTVENIRKLGQKRENWKCDSCKSNKTGAEKISETEELVNKLFLKFKSELETCVKEPKREIIEIKKSVQFMSDKFDEYSVKIGDILSELKQLRAENSALKKEVDLLTDKVDNLQQDQRRNNVQINGVNETKNENIASVVKAIGKSIDLQINDCDLNHVYRQRKRSNASGPVIVSFTTQSEKERFVHAYKTAVRNQNNGPGISANKVHKELGSGKIFVGDHLTPKNAILLRETKAKLKGKNFKYIWTNDGKIYARKSEGDQAIRIRNNYDLNILA